MIDPYQRIEQAIAFIQAHVRRQPQLAEVAAAVGMSPWHFQRMFRQWAGLSPKRYQAFLTVAHARDLLRGSLNVLDTAHELGLSGPARLHDHFVSLQAMTPGEFKRAAAGMSIHYGFHDSPYGDTLIAATARGVCHLAFTEGKGRGQELERLQRLYAGARLHGDRDATMAVAARIFGGAVGGQPIHLAVRGTNLQVQVWRAVLEIPCGATRTYGEVASAIGRPKAARPVASAIAANPVNFLIPCHRVLRADGQLGGFRGGEPCKARLLAAETASAFPAIAKQPE